MSDAGAGDDRRALPRLLVALLGYFVAGDLCRRALGVVGPEPSRELVSLVHAAGCVGLCGVALVWPASARLAARGAPAAVGRYLAFLLVWAPFSLFAYPWLLRTCGVEFAPQPQLAYFTAPTPDRWQFQVLLASTVLLSPLAEELCFRGYLRDLLRSVLAPTPALLLNSALFGLIHGPTFALPLTLLGLLFGWLRERYGNLGAPFVAHALHNALTVTLAVLWPDLLGKIYGQ